jgi:hypothetical protein
MRSAELLATLAMQSPFAAARRSEHTHTDVARQRGSPVFRATWRDRSSLAGLKPMFIVLSLSALGCSTSGNSGQPGQQPPGLGGLFAQNVPAPAQQEQPAQPIPPMQPVQPAPPLSPMQPPAAPRADPDADAFAQAEAARQAAGFRRSIQR